MNQSTHLKPCSFSFGEIWKYILSIRIAILNSNNYLQGLDHVEGSHEEADRSHRSPGRGFAAARPCSGLLARASWVGRSLRSLVRPCVRGGQH